MVTTRYSVPDLQAFWQTTAPEMKLLRLSRQAGVQLLQIARREGRRRHEFETLVEDVKGHALTLNLLGTYLHDAHAGDIRKRDLVKLEEADAEEQGGHAFRVMDAYVQWFESDGEKGRRALADAAAAGPVRPAGDGRLPRRAAAGPAIPGLTEPLVGLSEAQRNIALKRLEEAKLLTVNRDASGTLRLARCPSAAARVLRPATPRATTRRLARRPPAALRTPLRDHEDEGTSPHSKTSSRSTRRWPTAARRGCSRRRVTRFTMAAFAEGRGFYSSTKLGAFGSDLGAVACFFESPWSRVSPALTEAAQAWLLNDAAFVFAPWAA